MFGRVLDCRPPRQFQRVTLKAAGVSEARVGKTDLHLPGFATVKAEQPLDRQFDENLLPADRNCAETPRHHAALSNMAGRAAGAAERPRSLLDSETDRPGLEIKRHFLIPADAKGVI
jgi:hypothetical protein